MQYLKKPTLICASLILTACSQGITQNVTVDNGPLVNEILNRTQIQSTTQPSARPTTVNLLSPKPVTTASTSPAFVPAPSVQPSAAPVTSKAPSIASVGRIPRNGVVNGSEANDIGLNDTQILSPDSLTAAGSFGVAVVSLDGGKSWSNRRFSESEVYSITLRGNDLIAGRNGGVFIWDDQLQNWQILSTDITDEVARISFFDEQNGIAIGGYQTGRLFQTTDGGKTWSEIGTIPAGRNGTTQIKISIIDAGAKSASILADGVLYIYNDGSLQTSLSALHCCNGGSAFRDNQNGFAFSSLGGYVTKDGGQTFEKQASLVLDGSVVDMSNVSSMSFGSANDGLLLVKDERLQQGKAYVTRNGGMSWQLLNLNASIVGKLKGLRAFLIHDELIGLAYDNAQPEAYPLYRIRVPL